MFKEITCRDCNGKDDMCETCLGEGTEFKYVTSLIDMDNRPLSYGRAWRKPERRKPKPTSES